MPVATKIILSEKEISMVMDRSWILTKLAITEKVFELFSSGIEGIREVFLDGKSLPKNIELSVPKIFKGENYRQLPYVILDYPRCFEKENIFAVRTMFWWGNFVSITLHLSGTYKRFSRDFVYRTLEPPVDGLFIGVNENQWQHHFEPDNFIPFCDLSMER